MEKFAFKAVAAALAFVLLAGCGIVDTRVVSVITRHSDFPPGGLEGSFVVVPLETQNGSVEYRQYARYVEEKLIEQGFHKGASEYSADYLVMFDYGVGGSHQLLESSFTEKKTTIQATTLYDRFFDLKILDLKRSTPQNMVGVYEGTVKSSGLSENFSTVSYCMIDALFRDFFTDGTDDSDLSFVKRLGDFALGSGSKCMR